MKLKLTIQYIIAFLALTFVMHEFHEIVHTSVGRLICGCWGERDFNVWGLCAGCSEEKPIALIATFAGPIFTFIIIWIGAFLLSMHQPDKRRKLGFALVFANLPFARILTASMGGGDEVYGLSHLMDYNNAWLIGLLAIVLIVAFPLYRAFMFIKNKRRVGWFLLFFLAPTFIDLLLILGVMNSLLSNGVLSDYWILGSPMIVTIWTISVVVLLVFTWRYLLVVEEDPIRLQSS